LALVDDGYDHSVLGEDQSLGAAEVGIEAILQKHVAGAVVSLSPK